MINSSIKDECVDNEVVNQENTLSKETRQFLHEVNELGICRADTAFGEVLQDKGFPKCQDGE
jgi:hypothetical protein